MLIASAQPPIAPDYDEEVFLLATSLMEALVAIITVCNGGTDPLNITDRQRNHAIGTLHDILVRHQIGSLEARATYPHHFDQLIFQLTWKEYVEGYSSLWKSILDNLGYGTESTTSPSSHRMKPAIARRIIMTLDLSGRYDWGTSRPSLQTEDVAPQSPSSILARNLLTALIEIVRADDITVPHLNETTLTVLSEGIEQLMETERITPKKAQNITPDQYRKTLKKLAYGDIPALWDELLEYANPTQNRDRAFHSAKSVDAPHRHGHRRQIPRHQH